MLFITIVLQCGFNSTFMLLNDGTMLTCGSNKYGQLGVTNFKESLSFEKQAQSNEDPIDIAETSSEDSDESGMNGEGQSE